eukprot:TRINITY_DN3664_c0_g1_i1.p1 TRINITY_DN3664_c0_g1~~TRINITY_DN3664_c0_g1_i1.p1  ORF type:complete len:457 (+),score=39.41 TRINITY_DN3664_c0_g1_i1:659-2029(+)
MAPVAVLLGGAAHSLLLDRRNHRSIEANMEHDPMELDDVPDVGSPLPTKLWRGVELDDGLHPLLTYRPKTKKKRGGDIITHDDGTVSYKKRYGISTNSDRASLPDRLVHHFSSTERTTYDSNSLRIDEDEKAPGHFLFSPSKRMSIDNFHRALSQVLFLKVELKASGERASESSSYDLSYEEEFILWMLEEWQLSLPVAERTSVDYVIHSLGTGDFYEHLTPGEPELGYVLEAWEYVRSTASSDRFAKNKTLANYVPYALQRVDDYLTELSSMDLLLFEEIPILPGEEVAKGLILLGSDILQTMKLLSYSQGIFFAMLRRPLFVDPIERWDYGPVPPSLYFKFHSISANNDLHVSHMVKIFLSVVKRFLPFHGATLINMTHRHPTWKGTERNNVMSIPDLARDVSLDVNIAQFTSDFVAQLCGWSAEESGQREEEARQCNIYLVEYAIRLHRNALV